MMDGAIKMMEGMAAMELKMAGDPNSNDDEDGEIWAEWPWVKKKKISSVWHGGLAFFVQGKVLLHLSCKLVVGVPFSPFGLFLGFTIWPTREVKSLTMTRVDRKEFVNKCRKCQAIVECSEGSF